MTTPAELRSKIEMQGAEIALLTEEIEERIEQLKDWRSNVEQKPIKSVAIALGAGFFISSLATPMVRTLGRQAGVAIKASMTAYLTALFTDKLRQISWR